MIMKSKSLHNDRTETDRLPERVEIECVNDPQDIVVLAN